jgi:hypothetical protein
MHYILIELYLSNTVIVGKFVGTVYSWRYGNWRRWNGTREWWRRGKLGWCKERQGYIHVVMEHVQKKLKNYNVLLWQNAICFQHWYNKSQTWGQWHNMFTLQSKLQDEKKNEHKIERNKESLRMSNTAKLKMLQIPFVLACSWPVLESTSYRPRPLAPGLAEFNI